MLENNTSQRLPFLSRYNSWIGYIKSYPIVVAVIIGLFLLAGCNSVNSAPDTVLEETLNSTDSLKAAATNTIALKPTETLTPTISPSPTPEISADEPILILDEIDQSVRAFPGPTHYEGDQLIFELNVNEFVEAGEAPVSVQVDDQDPIELTGEWRGSTLIFSFDTSGLTGEHELTISAQKPGVSVNEIYLLDLLPASQRPEQESEAAWSDKEIECCVLHYITNTAAARDLEWISEVVQEAADEFDQFPDVDITEKIDIFFIDRMWYNGAFGGAGELLAVYTDRYYGPAQGEDGLKTLVRHELGHALFQIFSYGEGLSVYLAGGHYKPEPIPERAAALVELGYLGRTSGLTIGYQHESVYLYQAAIVSYMVETYGWDGMWAFVDSDSQLPQATPEERDQVFQETFGVSKTEFEQEFYDWVVSHEPTEQEVDLKLTIELQDLRREYQKRFTPEPMFLLGYSDESFAKPEYLLANIREANSPANIATELLIADAQQAINDGQYEKAQRLVGALMSILASGRLDHNIAREYGSIVSVLAEQGYEIVSLDLDGDTAEVVVTQNPPELETVTLQKVNGVWEK